MVCHHQTVKNSGFFWLYITDNGLLSLYCAIFTLALIQKFEIDVKATKIGKLNRREHFFWTAEQVGNATPAHFWSKN